MLLATPHPYTAHTSTDTSKLLLRPTLSCWTAADTTFSTVCLTWHFVSCVLPGHYGTLYMHTARAVVHVMYLYTKTEYRMQNTFTKTTKMILHLHSV